MYTEPRISFVERACINEQEYRFVERACINEQEYRLLREPVLMNKNIVC